MRRGFLCVAALAAAAIVVAAVPAASVRKLVGTDRSDLIRGTGAADVIYGKGGNDRLFGNGGNDLIVGGAGVDRVSCGRGVDRVRAEHRDKIGKDCEVVTYVDRHPAPPAHPSPAPAPTPTQTAPSPPAPPPARPKDGHYAGKTAQGEVVSFDVSRGGTTVSSLHFVLDHSCSPRGSFTITFDFGGPYSVAVDGTFGADWSGSLLNLDGSPSNSTATGSFRGRLDTNGNADGTVRGSANLVYAGGFPCSSDTVSWTATTQ